MKNAIGIMFILLGAMTADSEWLVVPVVLVGIGAIILRRAKNV